MPLFYIALGGAIGSIARFLLSSWSNQTLIFSRLPIGTLLVNLTGCLITGILAGLAQKHSFFTHETRLFIFTGIMGGFTTFSAFGLETVELLRHGDTRLAIAYVGLSVIIGILLLSLGIFITLE